MVAIHTPFSRAPYRKPGILNMLSSRIVTSVCRTTTQSASAANRSCRERIANSGEEAEAASALLDIELSSLHVMPCSANE
jgi:hypothetical protein